MSRPASDFYLTSGQIAHEVGVNVGVVNSWIDKGLLPGVRLPHSNGSPGQSRRRVRREDFEEFRKIYKFARYLSPDLVLAIGCEFTSLDNLQVVTASSCFQAGGLLVTRAPQWVVVDWSIGRTEASQIASGVRMGGYDSILVLRTSIVMDRDEHVRCGYLHVVRSVTADVLRSLLPQSLIPRSNGRG